MNTFRHGVLIVLLSAVCLSAGCRRYPHIENTENLQLLSALQTACSTRNPDWLEQTAETVEARRADGTLTDAEYQAVQTIIARARSGQWQEAEQETFRFLQAQAR